MANLNTKTTNNGREHGWICDLYRRIAGVYNAIRPLWSSRAAEVRLDSLFAERIGPTTKVLELAPGTGINIERLFRCSPRFDSYLGIDVSSEMLDRARVVARDDSRVSLQIGDATDLAGLDGPFDFIVCTWLLSHLERPERVVRDALRHLEPGGTAAFLFFTRADNLVVRSVVAAFVRSFRGAFVDAQAVSSIANLEVLVRYRTGYATLAVFHKRSEPDSQAPQDSQKRV